jgi:arsenate reductase
MRYRYEQHYHLSQPACGTSRNTLEMIRNSGNEPTIIYYLDTPPTRDELIKLISDMGITVRALLRKNVEPYEHLGLDEEKFSDEQLIDFMLQHPILINRPVVVTPLGTRLCRPSEIVLDILPEGQKGAFTKEDGEKVIDEKGLSNLFFRLIFIVFGCLSVPCRRRFCNAS